MKLLMIDGNSIVNRAFYGIRMLNAPDGTPTNAVYGFITILQRLLDEEHPDGVCVAFDLKAPTFRHLQYELYKAQRKGMPEELAVQMPILKSVLDAMGIFRVEHEGLEADDLLGTMSRRAEALGHESVIVTGDKDSFQLITERTRVLHVKTRMGQTETISYTPTRFEDEYGFAPRKMIDLKALMGDASDNIPGVAGVGEKTALDLLHRFGSVEAIYKDLDTLDIRDSLRKKLAAGADSAKMSYELATIITDADIPVDFDKARWNGQFGEGLYELFLQLGFTKFIEKYHLSPSVETAAEVSRHALCDVTALTTQTALHSAWEGWHKSGEELHIYCDASLGTVALEQSGCAWVWRKEHYDGDATVALELLFDPALPKVGHHIKDIQRVLLGLGLSPEGWCFDTALAAYLLDATAGSYELPRLCVNYCGYEPWRSDSQSEGQMSLLDMAEENDEDQLREQAALAAAIGELRGVLDEKLRNIGCAQLYYEVELPLCEVLSDMEHEGFLVDKQALYDFGESLTGSIDALQRSIWELAGGEFNINSPKQLGVVLFEKLMLPAGKKTKTGWSTNADVLEKLRDKHPIINEILDYRMLTKLKSTYADGLLKVIGPDGRIHTSFQMTVTATGRLSSTEPNLQNIPVRRELGAQIRRMFVAPQGMTLVDADYSQIELRLLAHISGDENMSEAFRSGEDIHTVTASQVFGIPLTEVTKLQRSHAKAVNFGIVYGISAWSLAQDIGVFPNEAKAYMDAYLEKYHGVREYQKQVVEQAKADGYAATVFGRRRALPELKSSNFNLRAFGERVAMNMPIQGTAADVIKLAMVKVYRRLKAEGLRSRLILQVHDELIAQCPLDEAETVKALIAEEMEGAAQFSVPLVADANMGQSWAEAH